MISVKVHKSSKSFVTCVCDLELVGKVFKEGKLILNIKENFYKGEEVKEEEVSKHLEGAVNLNVVGERAVGIVLKLGLISKENILFVQGVPHAQSILL